MNRWLAGLLIGLGFGFCGFIPIAIEQLPWYHVVRPLSYWGTMGVIIVAARVDCPPWLKGMIFGTLMALPMAVVLFPRSLAYTLIVSSILFGPMMAVLGERLARSSSDREQKSEDRIVEA